MPKKKSKYGCKDCNKSFSNQNYLDRHITKYCHKNNVNKNSYEECNESALIDSINNEPVIHNIFFELPKDDSEVNCDILEVENDSLINNYNKKLDENNHTLKTLNESILQYENEVKDLVANKYVLSLMQETVENNIHDTLIKYLDARIDIIKYKFDKIRILRKNKLDVLTENFDISAKIIEHYK